MDLLGFSLICRKRVRVSLCYPYLIYPDHGWAPQSAIQDTLTFTSVWLVFSYMNYFFVCVCLRQGWNFNIIINMLLIIVHIEYLHTLHYSVLLTIHRRDIFSPSRHVKKYTELHIISRTDGAQSLSHIKDHFSPILLCCWLIVLAVKIWAFLDFESHQFFSEPGHWCILHITWLLLCFIGNILCQVHHVEHLTR